MGKKLEDMALEELKKELDYWTKQLKEWEEEDKEKNALAIGACNLYRFEIIREIRKFKIF